MTLSEDAKTKIAAFSAKQVVHARQKDVLKRVWRSLESAVSDKSITIVVGPSGVGKTNLLDLVQYEAGLRLRSESDRDGRLAYVCVSAQPPPRDTFRFVSLYTSILDSTDDLLTLPKRLILTPGRTRPTGDTLQIGAINALRHRRPIVFCIDEAQHLTYAVRAQRLRIHFDLVKSLADQIDSPILMAGTHEVLEMALASGQLARWVRHIDFMPYRANDTEMTLHYGAVKYFIRELPVRLAFEPSNHAAFFYERSVGSIGVLKPWFERVLRSVLSDGRTSATLTDFQEAAMPLGKLQLLASEYADAMKSLRLVEGDETALRAALGMAQAVTAPRASSGGRVGERTLKRDPVGTAA